MFDVIFFLASRKSKYQKANLLPGRPGEAPRATQGTGAASIWRALAGGLCGALLALANFVFMKMCKTVF